MCVSRPAKFSACSFLLILFLAGCIATASNMQTADDLEHIERGSSVVFGKVEWLENGEIKNIGGGVFSMSVKPHLIRMEDKSRIMGEVSDDGKFVWSLTPGTYLIHKMAYWDTWSGNYFVVPKVAFSVPEEGKTFYIGALKAEFEPKRDLIGGLSGKVKFTIQDESVQDIADFTENYSLPSNEINKNLMIHDARLPKSIETTHEFNIAMSIINAILYGISQ